MTMIRLVVLAMIAMVMVPIISSAQTPSPATPSLSIRSQQYFRDHPEEWQEFLTRPAQAAVGTPYLAPAGGSWSVVPGAPNVSLVQPQLMTDGSVLFNAFCTPGNWWKLTPSNTGSYSAGTWTQIASLPVINGLQYNPLWYASHVLPDGRLIINGGEYNRDTPCTNTETFTTKGAIYDPFDNTWTAVAPPSSWTQIGDAQSIVLANGTYMLANSQSSQQALLNAFNFTWTATGTGKADGNDEEGWTLLPDATVLTVDAACGDGSERYTPTTGAWTSAGSTIVQLPDCNGNASFELGPQVLRPDGTVVVFGGTTTGVAHTAIFNTANNTWSQGPDIPSTCGAMSNTPCTLADAPAALLQNGNILFAAATSNWTAKNSFFAGTHFFEMNSSNVITQVTDTSTAPSDPSYVNNFVLLPTGDVLRTNISSNVQIYTPTDKTFQSTWRPVVNSAPSCISAGGTYFVSGTQFNGLSHGAAYGDDYQSDTNFPLVRIVNNSTGHVAYARTFDHNTRSIAVGAATSTKFRAPQVIEDGASTLFVVANGIPSVGTAVTVASSSCSKGGTTTATHDFNGSSSIPESDIAWRDASGATAVWFMFNATINDSGGFGVVPNTWSIVGQRDFNGDGAHDWLWRDSSGNLAIWFMFGKLAPTTANLGNVNTVWAVQGTGDFNGDGKGDILWRNTSTGVVAIWLLNGSTVSSSATVSTVPSNWVIAGTGDFNGDGKTDILWRDTTTGTAAIWFMNGTTVLSTTTVGAVASNWVIAGVGDFNGDGKSDILWRDTSAGSVAIWLLNGGSVGATGGLGTVPSNWVIANTGDFNGNGKSDILWRDTSSGALAIWFINGVTVASSASVGSVGTSWVVQGLNAD